MNVDLPFKGSGQLGTLDEGYFEISKGNDVWDEPSLKDLRPLLHPRSIAVAGASERFGVGSLAIENLRTLGFQGTIIPVNFRFRRFLQGIEQTQRRARL